MDASPRCPLSPEALPPPPPPPPKAWDDGPFRLVPSSVQLAGLVSFRHGFGRARSMSGLSMFWRWPWSPMALFIPLVQCWHHWPRENSDETAPTPNSCFCRPRRRAGTGLVGLASSRSRSIGLGTARDHPQPHADQLGQHRPGEEGRYRLHVVPVQCDGDLRLRFSTTHLPAHVWTRASEAVEWPGLDAEETTPSSSGLLETGGLPTARPLQPHSPAHSPARPGTAGSQTRVLAEGKKNHEVHGSMALDHNTLHRRICASSARPHTA